MTAVPSGTRRRGLRGFYSDEQHRTLAAIACEGALLRAAVADVANHVLWADGSISADIDTMVASVLATGDKKKMDEVNAALAEARFLFVVDDGGVPGVYFQCAVPGNPDVVIPRSPMMSDVALSAAVSAPVAAVPVVVVGPRGWRQTLVEWVRRAWRRVVSVVRRMQ